MPANRDPESVARDRRRVPRRVEVRLAAEGRLAVRFSYAPDLNARIKEIPGRGWHQGDRHWSIPAHTAALALLVSKFRAEDLVLEDRVERLLPKSGLEHARWRRFDPAQEALQGEWRRALGRMREELSIRGYADTTKTTYLSHTKRLGAYTGVLPRDLRVQHVCRYLDHVLVERELSTSYADQTVSAAKFLFRHVLGRPVDKLDIPRPKREQKLPAVLSKNEVLRILEAVENRKHRAILMLAYGAGLRVSEVVGLKVADLDADRRMVHIRRSKGRKDRYVPLADEALRAIQLYRRYHPSAGPWLFPGQKKGRHLTSRTVQKVVARAREAAAFEKQPTPHTLRHSFATHLHEGGIGIRYIQELLGHKSAQTTEIYTHISRARLRDIQSPLDQIMAASSDDNAEDREGDEEYHEYEEGDEGDEGDEEDEGDEQEVEG